MRPLEIDLTAFRSYDRATVDLRPHDLVVISGDTGAGKSSLLDAIAFALFGTTPEKAGPKDLLTLGRTHGEVRLTFAAKGEVWRMTRRYGPDAPDPSHVLERLDGDGGPALETIGGEEAVSVVLDRVVGMSFRAFTSAVLLAQGRFAEFLGAQPRDRDAILRELFNVASLEGARLAAGRAQAAAEGEAGAYERDAARLPGHGAGIRAAAARDLRAAAARHAAARRLLPLSAAAGEHREAAATARARAAAARAAAAELPDRAAGDALLGRLTAAAEAVAAARTERDRAADAAGEAAARVAALRERHGGDGAALAGLAVRAEVAGRLAAELPARQADLEARRTALAPRGAALDELRATLAAAESERDGLAARIAAVDAWSRTGAALEQAAANVERAAAAAAGAARERQRADAAREAAAAHARAVRRDDLAAALRADLEPGDSCPVCGAAVGDHQVETGDLDAADGALARADAAAMAAGRAQAEADERARVAAEALQAARAAREAAERALAGTGVEAAEAASGTAPLQERAGQLAPAISAARAGLEAEVRALAAEESAIAGAADAVARDMVDLQAARAQLGAWAGADDAGAALRAAIAEVTAAEDGAAATAAETGRCAEALAGAEREQAALAAGPVAALRAQAARVAGRDGLDAPADDLEPAGLVSAAVALRAAAEAAGRIHEEAAGAAEARAVGAEDALRGAAAAIGIEDPSRLQGAARRLAAERDDARERRAAVEAAAGEARRLADAAAEARERARVHQQVANDLRANMFPRFLLNRYQERLATGASVRLQELTGDGYRFAGTGADALAVVDMRRGERQRRAATLSGGERFLASLALALGLADIAAESGGRLDCLFLDEGFSTLDADSLEQAMAGIERLAGDGRLVAVITHLPGVADRLGAAIHVEKDVAGVSRVRAGQDGGAGPIAEAAAGDRVVA